MVAGEDWCVSLWMQPHTATVKERSRCSRTSWGTEMRTLEEDRGQMTVEAALLIPVVLALIALLVQPACVLYTRSVMAATAGELCRLQLTRRYGEDEARDYAFRRLAAIPDVAIFHEGGLSAWEVSVEGPDEQGAVTASVKGRVRPLPLLGALVAPLGTASDGCVVVCVQTTAEMRSAWVEGGYGDWVEMWG